MAWTSPSTWAAGATVTAAQLNTQLRDNMKAIGDPWTSYGTLTTLLTGAGGNPTFGSGAVGAAAYIAAGKLIHFRIQIISGSSGTAAGTGNYQFLLPVAPIAGITAPLGHGVIMDGAVGTALGAVGSLLYNTGTTGYFHTTTGMVTAATFNVVANRRYLISGTYEAA